MPKTQFPRLARAVAEMTPHQRKTTALALSETSQPVLHALALELMHANAVEEADLAQHAVELQRYRSAQLDQAVAEAGIPAPGSPAEHAEAVRQRNAAWGITETTPEPPNAA